MSELARQAEVAPLGISVTCVEPGPFRTDWAGRSLKQTPKHAIADYADTAGRRRISRSPATAASRPAIPAARQQAIIDPLTQIPNPPRHLVLGARGWEMVSNRLKARLDEIEAWRGTAVATDYPQS